MQDGTEVAWLVVANAPAGRVCPATAFRLAHASRALVEMCASTRVADRFSRAWERERAKRAVLGALAPFASVAVYARVGDRYPAPWIVLNASRTASTVTVWNTAWTPPAAPVAECTASHRAYATPRDAVADFAELAAVRRLRRITAVSTTGGRTGPALILQLAVERLFPPDDVCDILD
jgi:hypothetical protein